MWSQSYVQYNSQENHSVLYLCQQVLFLSQLGKEGTALLHTAVHTGGGIVIILSFLLQSCAAFQALWCCSFRGLVCIHRMPIYMMRASQLQSTEQKATLHYPPCTCRVSKWKEKAERLYPKSKITRELCSRIIFTRHMLRRAGRAKALAGE